jgi:hypothetical protein
MREEVDDSVSKLSDMVKNNSKGKSVLQYENELKSLKMKVQFASDNNKDKLNQTDTDKRISELEDLLRKQKNEDEAYEVTR